MNISLINGYYIDVTPNNFTMKHRYIGTRKDGTKKEAVKIHGHYGSLEQALETFLKLYQIDRGARFAVDLMEYANYIEQSNKEAVRALKSVLDGKESDDDVCEWKLDGVFIHSPHEIHMSCVDEENYRYNYCPYCGKKIKVVGNHEVN